MKYKGCPRCKRKMPLEVKGQCEECKRNRYKYLEVLSSVKRDRVQRVYNNPQWREKGLKLLREWGYVKFVKYREGLEQEMKYIILLRLLMKIIIVIMIWTI